MSAFGRRSGMGNGQPARPAFGVARPMQGSGPARPEPEPAPGSQFPPIDSLPMPGETEVAPTGNMPGQAVDAMQRLADR